MKEGMKMLDKKYDSLVKEEKWLNYWKKNKYMNLNMIIERCIR